MPTKAAALNKTAAKSGMSGRFLSGMFAGVLGIAVTWQVLREPGVVGFVHDWSIAPFGAQHIALFHQMLDGWYSWGLGQAAAYPVGYPLILAFASAAILGLGGAAISKGFVVAVPALSFLSAAYLARRCGFAVAPAWLTGCFYALDPVMLNKLVAGQETYLSSYAVFPLVPAMLLIAMRVSNPVLGGVAVAGALAVASMELQLGMLAAALGTLVLSFARVDVRRKLVIVGATAVSMAVIEAPTLVWATHGIASVAQLDQFRHGAAWLQANSLTPASAVRLIGYLTRYDVLAVGGWMSVWQPASWSVVAVAVAGLFLLRGPLGPALIAGTAASLLIACGTTTPLGVPITWLFEHVAAAQVFRELYHVMAVPSLAYAMGVGAAFAAAGAVRFGGVIRSVILVAVAIYLAPTLSGDVSGWLQAVPIDAYLYRAFAAEGTGAGRVVWFPMDQPLAFDDHGSGVDPLGVTPRGSLWLYSLAWPLDAVDADARRGDMTALRRDLRALGVATAVERDRLHSRYRGVPGAASLAVGFFGPDVRLTSALGERVAEGPGVWAFRVPQPLPLLREARRAAVVPLRFSVVSELALSGAAVFGFEQELPKGIPYDLYADAADRPWEALEAAGQATVAPETGVDPAGGFAGGDLWWWLRPQYADARRFVLAIGQAQKVLTPRASLRDARLVVAWIATPVGGTLAVRCGGTRTTLDTGGDWSAWRSAAVPCGSLAAGSTVTLTAGDPQADVALRGATLVDGPAYGAALHRLDRLAGAAAHRELLDAAPRHGGRLVGSGSSPALGSLAAGEPAILMLRRRSASGEAVAVVQGSQNDVLAIRHFAPGRRDVEVPLLGAPRMVVHTAAPIVRWRLWVYPRRTTVGLRGRPPAASTRRVIIADSTYDGGWRLDGASTHLVTALGTNAFLLPKSDTRAPALRYAYSKEYHIAYFLGSLALVLAVVTALALSAGPRAVHEAA